MKTLLSAIFVVSIGLTATQGWAAGNTRIESFNQAKKLLEQKVYFDHRETFYCRATFDSKKNVTLPKVEMCAANTEEKMILEGFRNLPDRKKERILGYLAALQEE